MAETENTREELERLVPGQSWPRVYPGEIPGGYFERLPGRVLQAVAEAREEPGTLSWDRTNPYSVPEGYFDRLPGVVTRKLSGAPVVTLPRQRRTRWSSWLAAAVMTGIVTLSALVWFTRPPAAVSSVSVDQQIASLSSEAIEQYLNDATNTLNSDEILNTLTDDDLQGSPAPEPSGKALEEYLNQEIPDSLY